MSESLSVCVCEFECVCKCVFWMLHDTLYVPVPQDEKEFVEDIRINQIEDNE